MKKYIEIPIEVLECLADGKCVKGSLRINENGKLAFRAYVRQSRENQDRVICQLENGWLKESPRRIKFYNSVKKNMATERIEHVMFRELRTAMDELLWEESITSHL